MKLEESVCAEVRTSKTSTDFGSHVSSKIDFYYKIVLKSQEHSAMRSRSQGEKVKNVGNVFNSTESIIESKYVVLRRRQLAEISGRTSQAGSRRAGEKEK